MIQSHVDLQRLLDGGQLVVTPLVGVVQPASIDLSLGDGFKWWDKSNRYIRSADPVDLSKSITTQIPSMLEIRSPRFVIEPGMFALGHTAELGCLGRCAPGWRGKAALGG